MPYVPCITRPATVSVKSYLEAVSHWVVLFPVSLHCMVKPVAHACWEDRVEMCVDLASWFGIGFGDGVQSRVLHCRDATHCAHAQDCCRRLHNSDQSDRQLQQHQYNRRVCPDSLLCIGMPAAGRVLPHAIV